MIRKLLMRLLYKIHDPMKRGAHVKTNHERTRKDVR